MVSSGPLRWVTWYRLDRLQNGFGVPAGEVDERRSGQDRVDQPELAGDPEARHVGHGTDVAGRGAGAQIHHPARGAGMQHVALRVHAPLRHPGGAAGVVDAGQVVEAHGGTRKVGAVVGQQRRQLEGAGTGARRLLQQLRERQAGRAREVVGEAGDDHRLEVGFVPRCLDQRIEPIHRHQDSGVGVDQLVAQFVLLEHRVHRHVHATELEDAVEHDEVLRTVVEQHRHAVSAYQPARLQEGGEPVAGLVELGVGEPIAVVDDAGLVGCRARRVPQMLGHRDLAEWVADLAWHTGGPGLLDQPGYRGKVLAFVRGAAA